MNPITNIASFSFRPRPVLKALAGQTMPARLQVIHDLIRSGDYQVPASAIADRMLEQMIFWQAAGAKPEVASRSPGA